MVSVFLTGLIGLIINDQVGFRHFLVLGTGPHPKAMDRGVQLSPVSRVQLRYTQCVWSGHSEQWLWASESPWPMGNINS